MKVSRMNGFEFCMKLFITDGLLNEIVVSIQIQVSFL